MNQSTFKPTHVLIQVVAVFLILVSVVSLSLAAKVADAVQLTDKEKNWLEAHPIIRLAPDPSFQPIEYFDENGNYEGVGADYVRLIEKKLGISFEIVQCSNWDDVVSRMKRHEVDVLNAVIRTPQREEYMQFPPPYLTIPSVIIVRKNVNRDLTLKMLEGMHVVMVSGYGYVDLIQNKFPEVNIELVSDLKAALRKVSFGMADAFVGDLATASFYIESEGITNLRLAGETDPPNISGFAVRSDWPELSGILEKGVSLITEAEREAIFSKWIHLEPEPGVSMRELRHLILIIIGVIVLIIAGFLLWNRSLKRMVHRRTESLRKEIEERNRAEKAVRLSEEQFRHFFEHLTIGVAIYEAENDGEDFVFFDINPAGQKLSRVSLDEIRGKRLSETFPGVKDLGLFKALQNVWRTGHPEYVPFGLYKDERIHQWVENRVFKLPSGKVVAVYDDQTKRMRLEERLRQAQKMESIGTLAGGIAHQFNNALAVVTGNIELLEMDSPDNKAIAHYVTQIKISAKRMAELTAQLLTYARGGKYQANKISLSDFFRDILPLTGYAENPAIHIDTYFADDIFNIEVDPAQLKIVLSGILLNASEAMAGKGHIRIDCRNEMITEQIAEKFPGFRSGSYACMTITDDGKGMDEETKNRVFEPFFTTKFKGRGLGMAAAYGFAKNHNGYIMVDSELGRGTTVKIYLPAYESPDEEEAMTNRIN